ncbi:MAG: 4Fe-4S binding protein [Methanomicrobia archaeon]|nr:4Fe-4S binding protein [Methanomicrobia archaeon]
MKLGVFLCTCNSTMDIDFRNVRKSIKKEVEIVETVDQLCQRDVDYIIDDIRRLGLDAILIATCTEKRRTFERVASGFGCDTYVLNLREHCGWVHGKKEGTEKAKSMIKAAISYAEKEEELPRPEKIDVDVGFDVLVIGNEAEGALDVAKSLSNVAHVHLLTKNVHEWCDEPRLHIGTFKGITGEIGDFEVEIERNIDIAKCISCGLCADACPKNAVHYDAVYTIDETCDECGDCVSVCPTDAIAFHDEDVLHVGQILVIDKNWHGPNYFGIYKADDYEDALKKAQDLVSNLGEIGVEKYLEVDLKRCASGRSELMGCEYCLPCPYEAITREGVKMVFSAVRCRGCGLCASLCPLSVPQLRDYPNQLLYSQIESLLSEDLRSNVLLFADMENVEKLTAVGRKKLRYPAVVPLFVPSVEMVSEAHILSALERGADGVILWACEDGHHEHHEQIESAVTFAQKTLSAFGLGDRVLLLDDAPFAAEDFAKKVTDFVTKLSPSPIRKKKPVEIDFTEPKRAILRALMQSLRMKAGVHPTLREENTSYPFADVAINSNCTLCNACVTMCPTNALSKAENKIDFVYGDCIACGMCQQACPEEAIALKRVLDFSQLVDEGSKKLVEVEFVACAGCGELFMPKSAFERMKQILKAGKGEGELNVEERLDLLKYCQKCRPVRAVEVSLQKLEEEKE